MLTDERWTAGPSAVVADDFYDGESIDARLASDAWQSPGFTDQAWTAVTAQQFDTGKLIPYVGPPVIRHEEVRPVRVWKSSREDTGRLRPESRRLAEVHRPRGARSDDHHPSR